MNYDRLKQRMSLVQKGKSILANFEGFQLNTEFMQKKPIGNFFEVQLGILNRNWTLEGFPQFGFHMSHQSSVQHTNHHGYKISSTQSQSDNALFRTTYNTSTVFAGYRFE